MSWYWPPKDPSAPVADLLEVSNLSTYTPDRLVADLRQSGTFIYCETHLAPPHDTFQCGPIVENFSAQNHSTDWDSFLAGMDAQAVGTGVGPNYDWYALVPGIDFPNVLGSTEKNENCH